MIPAIYQRRSTLQNISDRRPRRLTEGQRRWAHYECGVVCLGRSGRACKTHDAGFSADADVVVSIPQNLETTERRRRNS